MSSYIGYRVRVFMQNNATFQGTIAFVDNHLIKLRNVQTNDQKRGIVKELLLKAADIKDLEVIGKDEDFRASTDSISPSPSKLAASSDKISQPESLSKSSGSIPPQQPPPPQQQETLLTPESFNPAQTEEKPSQPVPYQDPAIISIHNNLVQQQQQRQHLNMMLQQTPIGNLIRPMGVPPPMGVPTPMGVPPPMGMPPMFPPHFPPPMHMLPISTQPMHGPVAMFHPPPVPMGTQPPPPMQAPPVFNTNGRPPSPQKDEDRQRSSKSPGRRSTTPNRQGPPFKSPGKNQAYRKQDRETFSEPITEEINEDFDFEQSNSRFNKEQVYAELTDDYSRNKSGGNSRSKTPTRVPTISFTTQLGMRVTPVVADVMRQIYSVTQETGPNYYQIAENAGRALAKLALKMTRGKKNPRIVVLVGTSFNASCGLVAARHLANHSVHVSICRSRAYHLPDEVTFLRNVYQNSSGKEAQIGSLPVEPVDLIIDALIGCGLNGAPGGPTATLIGWANANGAPILSCDVPTGVDATTGYAPGDFIRPAATLALGLPKTGLLRERVGQLYLADVGLVSGTFAKVGIDYQSPFGDKFTVPLMIN